MIGDSARGHVRDTNHWQSDTSLAPVQRPLAPFSPRAAACGEKGAGTSPAAATEARFSPAVAPYFVLHAPSSPCRRQTDERHCCPSPPRRRHRCGDARDWRGRPRRRAGHRQRAAEQKARALESAANILRQRKSEILAANARDLGEAQGRGLSAAMIDRLTLDEKRIEAMAKGVEEVAKLPDPVGRVLATYNRPNGLIIERVSTPLGVIGVIYESRPNVTADAGALCLKSGNAVVLRGGSDSFSSSAAIHACLVEGLRQAACRKPPFRALPFRPRGCGRDAGGPRRRARRHRSPWRQEPGRPRAAGGARSSVRHLEGIVHVYVDATADLDKALKVLVNSKMRRTGICGAAETLLVERAGAPRLLKPLVEALSRPAAKCAGTRRRAPSTREVSRRAKKIGARNILTRSFPSRVVEDLDAAIEHIETMARTTPTASSPRIRRRPSSSCSASTRPSCS